MLHSPDHSTKSANWLSVTYQRLLFAHLLCFVAAWSLFIKYLFPVVFAVVYEEPVFRYVFWDFWPVAHLWLAWSLLMLPAYVRRLAWIITLAEIVIILVKFWLFLSAPEWDIWRTNWFVNKVFVLLTFLLMFGRLLYQPNLFGSNSGISAQ